MGFHREPSTYQPLIPSNAGYYDADDICGPDPICAACGEDADCQCACCQRHSLLPARLVDRLCATCCGCANPVTGSTVACGQPGCIATRVHEVLTVERCGTCPRVVTADLLTTVEYCGVVRVCPTCLDEIRMRVSA